MKRAALTGAVLGLLAVAFMVWVDHAQEQNIQRAVPPTSIWTNYTTADGQGGVIYSVLLRNPQDTNGLNRGIFRVDTCQIGLLGSDEPNINLGVTNLDFAPLIQNGNEALFFFGNDMGGVLHWTNSYDIFNIGDACGFSSTMDGVYDVFNYGDYAGYQMVAHGGGGHGNLFNYGASAGQGATYINSGGISWYGGSAGQNANLTNSSDIYGFGDNAGFGLVGSGLHHLFLLGSGANGTNSNDFVFGDTNYNYFFPGASVTMSGPLTNYGGLNVKAGSVNLPANSIATAALASANLQSVDSGGGNAANWNATGSTNSALYGNATVNSLTSTNGLTVNSGTFSAPSMKLSGSARSSVAQSSGIAALGTPYLGIGATEYAGNDYHTIGYGYSSGGVTNYPVEIGAQLRSGSGNTKGFGVIAVRSGTGNTAPDKIWQFTYDGQLTVPNCGGAPSGATLGAGGAALWSSNAVVYISYSADGSSVSTKQIAP